MSELGGGTVTTMAQHPDGSSSADAAPYLFLAIDCDRPSLGPSRYGLADVDRVLIGRGTDRAAALERSDDLRILRLRVPDSRVSTSHARLDRALGSWQLVDEGSKNGTYVNGHRVHRIGLMDGDIVGVGHVLFQLSESLPTPNAVQPIVDAHALPHPLPGLATLVPAFGDELERLAQLATSDLTILLLGETGTGKEVAARAIHAASARKGRFIAVNCGALPTQLVESELFGHVEGAFSGASADRLGLVRAAHGGTLLLDEVGDLPLSSQAALLRVLQEKVVRPIGATTPIIVDVRVIASTHRDLDALVEDGLFREDLLARLSTTRASLPALRDRPGDLGLLVAAVLHRTGTSCGSVSLDVGAAHALLAHDWPRNVRELVSALSAALTLAEGGRIEQSHLPGPVNAAYAELDLSPADAAIRTGLIGALRQHRGNISAVARELGKARQQVQRWIKRFGIQTAKFRK